MTPDAPPPADDFYGRLEVGAGASREEIARNYRRLAHGAHPDVHPGDPDAASRFRRLTEAYDVLADPARRARYDLAQGQQRHVAGGAAPAPPDRGAPTVLLSVPSRRPVGLGSSQLRAGPVHVDPHPAAPGPGPALEAEVAATFARVLRLLIAQGRLP